MAKTLPIWDRRMIELMDYCIRTGAVKNRRQFLSKIGIFTGATIKQVQDGAQSFRHKHLQAAGKLYGVSLDWIFGFSDSMYRETDKPKDGLKMLKEATRLIEANYLPVTKPVTKNKK